MNILLDTSAVEKGYIRYRENFDAGSVYVEKIIITEPWGQPLSAAGAGRSSMMHAAYSLLKKVLRPYIPSARVADRLDYNSTMRYAAKHGFLSSEDAEYWIRFRKEELDPGVLRGVVDRFHQRVNLAPYEVCPHDVTIKTEHRVLLKEFFNSAVPGATVRVYGSRVIGSGHELGDLDLAIMSASGEAIPDFGTLQVECRKLPVPFLLDILDWYDMPPFFRSVVDLGSWVL